MGNRQGPSDWVTVATVASVFDAEVVSAILRTEGIDAFIPNENTATMLFPMAISIKTGGVSVLVRGADADAAREVLARHEQQPEGLEGLGPEEEPSEGSVEDDEPEAEEEPDDIQLDQVAEKAGQKAADRYADAAARTCLFAWFLPPVAILTIYYLSQAIAAARDEPPADGDRYARNLWLAGVAGVGAAAAASILYYHIFFT